MNGMMIIQSKDALIRVLSDAKEQIEIDESTVMQTYFNPDANSGCQIVVNTWDTDQILRYAANGYIFNTTEELYQKLKDHQKSVSDLISELDLESEARQELLDIEIDEDGQIDYIDIVEGYINKPTMSSITLSRLKKEFDEKRPEGIMDHSYNVGIKNIYTKKEMETQGDLCQYIDNNLETSWSEFFNWLLQDMHEMDMGAYSELTIEYVENAGPADKDNEDGSESDSRSPLGVDCVLIDRVAEKIRTFDPYAYMDAGSDEENYQQITDDIYKNCAKETLRTLGEIRDFEKENDESYDDTEKLIEDVATEALVYAASFVDNSIAADVLAQSLMDVNVSTYDMFDDLQYMYLAANKEGKEYIDRTLTILLRNKMSELAGQILDEAKQAEAV